MELSLVMYSLPSSSDAILARLAQVTSSSTVTRGDVSMTWRPVRDDAGLCPALFAGLTAQEVIPDGTL